MASAQSADRITVRVIDEAGAPIVGAHVTVSTERMHRDAGETGAGGTLTTSVPAGVDVRLAAARDDYGLQSTDMSWHGWARYDRITTPIVTLTLRRGVVVRGRLLDESGAPRAHETLLLIPAYVGSGPFTLRAVTDAHGDFAFDRAVLGEVEIVARSLDEWHPETGTRPGSYVRVLPEASAWMADVRADRAITLRLETYALLRVEIATGLLRTTLEIWLRGGPRAYTGTAPRTDAHGHTVVLMERGVPYELWVLRERAQREAPWTQALASDWHGTLDAPTSLTLTPR